MHKLRLLHWIAFELWTDSLLKLEAGFWKLETENWSSRNQIELAGTVFRARVLKLNKAWQNFSLIDLSSSSKRVSPSWARALSPATRSSSSIYMSRVQARVWGYLSSTRLDSIPNHNSLIVHKLVVVACWTPTIYLEFLPSSTAYYTPSYLPV